MNNESQQPQMPITGNRKESNSFWQRQKILGKGIIISLLVLLLFIPTFFITGLIQERQNLANEVKNEIADQWGERQEIRGPVIAIPYWTFSRGDKGKTTKVKSHALFLPNKLNIKGELSPKIKYRSIFEMVVYKSEINISGSFDQIDCAKLKIPKENLILSEAQVLFGLNDFRGIKDDIMLKWNDATFVLNAGVPRNGLIKKGLNTSVPLTTASLTSSTKFSMQLTLHGSEALFFQPLGKTTEVNLKGKWKDPSFDGASPEYNITDSTFTAHWKLLGINRAYPQEWKEGDSYNLYLDKSAFGVNLLQPVNNYSKSMRSVKYGILIILLTFVVYFFIEIFQKKSAHAIQYVLVGFALCIFYILLISLAELVGFNWAYLIASGATVGLLGVYTTSVFQSFKSGLIFTVFLSGLYLFIFSLIQLQERALLFGSIGLFIILAIVMFVSRKINWHNK